jgi:hypothetical protein
MIEHLARAFKNVLQERCDSAMPCATVASTLGGPMKPGYISILCVMYSPLVPNVDEEKIKLALETVTVKAIHTQNDSG